MKMHKIQRDVEITETPVTAVEVESKPPTIYVPATPELVKAIKVGEGATVQINGKICGVKIREDNESYNRTELEIEVSEVGVQSAKNEFSDLAEHDE